MSKKVRGFDENARKIAEEEHLPMSRAEAILAASTRRTGPAARRRNPRLNRVKGRC
jgi:hypothetical protein